MLSLNHFKSLRPSLCVRHLLLGMGVMVATVATAQGGIQVPTVAVQVAVGGRWL